MKLKSSWVLVSKLITGLITMMTLCLASAGCQDVAGAETQPNGEQTNLQPSGLYARYTTPVILLPTMSPHPKKTHPRTPEKPPSPTENTVSPTSSLTPTPSATATALMITRICSPLETVALMDLPRVVSDHYYPPPKGSDARHSGVDFAYYHWRGGGPIDGVAVQAVLDGQISVSLKNTYPFGNVLVVETLKDNLPVEIQKEFRINEGESLYLLYAHMSDGSPLVELDQHVRACQPIGQVGKTGNASVPHLHLEARVGPAGLRFETFSYYQDGVSDQDRKNYRLWSVSGQYVTFDPMRLALFEYNHGATSTPKGMRAP